MKDSIRTLTILLAVAALTGLLLSTSLAESTIPKTTDPNRPGIEYRTDRILVKPLPGKSDARMSELHAANGGTVLRTFDRLGGLQVVQLPEGANVQQVIGRYTDSGLVRYAEPDYILHAVTTEPNDPYFTLDTYQGLWGMRNTGQPDQDNEPGAPGADIDAPTAWDTRHDATWTDGGGTHYVIVAVIDTGVRYTHEDLDANMWVNPDEIPGNGIDDDGNIYIDDIHGINSLLMQTHPWAGNPMDDYGHGTHVSGTIGGIGNNGKGVVGVAWQVKIMALKFLDSSGSGSTSNAIECIEYAISKGANIMSNSWGGGGYSEAMVEAITDARDAGIIFVAAAGNSGSDNDSRRAFPASYEMENIVSVAATDRNDQLADFSNYGQKSVDLGAPGVDITSCFNESDASYYTAEGTSMATPHVSGALALMKAEYPEETYAHHIMRLLASVDVIPALQGKCVSNGRLNLHKALTDPAPGEFFVSPEDDVSFGGLPGHDYGPPQTYRLLSFAEDTLNWQANKSASWLTVTPSSGAMDAKGAATVTVSINSNADSLSPGVYTDTVYFVNLLSGEGNTSREVTLTIGAEVIHVKPTGNDANDGSSWAQAKATVINAMAGAFEGQEIWVAAGTYSSSTATIVIKPGVSLYGGFNGDETSRDDRNPAEHVTILDGAGQMRVVEALESDLPAALDGFTVQNSGWNPGVVCRASGLTISNNTVVGCNGGGMVIEECSPLVYNNLLANNNSTSCGGIYLYDSQAVILNNTIAYNADEWSETAGIYCTYSSPLIANNIIAFNKVGIYGWSAEPELEQNDVYGNTTRNYVGLFPGETDISVDPLFYSQQDRHLTGASPCIDAGNPSFGPETTVDTDWQPRVQGDSIEIGADEVQPVATPAFSPDGGEYSSAQTVTVTCATSGATIHYTTDGRDPVPSDPVIQSGSTVVVDVSEVLKARAFATDLGPSLVKFAEYTISGTTGTVCTPQIQPGGGIYTAAQTVTITCPNTGSVIRFTTDGNDPTTSSTQYTGPISISSSTILKAKAWKDNWDPSAVATAAYSIISRLYVDENAVGPNHDGLSWDTAFLTVGAAMNFAHSGNEIWVADAEYQEPVVMRSGVALYGGFAGGETALEQRDWEANVATLKGDRTEPVVRFPSGTTGSTRLDGFTVTNGGGYWGGGIACYKDAAGVIAHNNITGNWEIDWGGGVYCVYSYMTITENQITNNSSRLGGGGILSAQSLVTITHNNISQNHTMGDELGWPGFGGGVYLSGPDPSVVSYNTICNNSVSGSGGGLDISGYSTAEISHNDISDNTIYFSLWSYGGGMNCEVSSPTITDNTINNNYGEWGGGGLNLAGEGSPLIQGNTISWNGAEDGGGIRVDWCTSPTILDNKIIGNYGAGGGGIECVNYITGLIANNLIYGNSAGRGGGGILCAAQSWMSVLNNTISNNSSGHGGGVSSEYGSLVTVKNNIIAFCSSGAYKDSTSDMTASSNCVYGNIAFDFGTESGAVWNPGGNIFEDPLLASSMYGDLHIQPDSPCRDAGDDSIVQSGWLDIDGQTRIQDSHVDMGADESDDTPYSVTRPIVRVHPDGDDGNDGSSWEYPKLTIAGAIEELGEDGGEIWVASGTYLEQIALPPYVYVYGGFGGAETARDQRNWADYVATVNAVTTTQYGPGLYAVKSVQGGALISGVDGFHLTVSGTWYPAIVYCTQSSPIIANSILARDGNGGWAAVYCDMASPAIINTVIKEITASADGGGVDCYLSSPVIVNSTIASNGSRDGGGISCRMFASPTIVNSIIAFNTSGIYRDWASEPLIRNSDVYGNAAYNFSYSDENEIRRSWDPTGATGNISEDPEFAAVDFGDLHIQATSPCVNAGATVSASQFWPLDMDCEARIYPTQSTVDMGADESDGTQWNIIPTIIRVRTDGNDNNDGSTWPLAKQTIQAAIDDLTPDGGEVWVATGTYNERITLPKYAYLYGGFEGNEPDRINRNWVDLPVTINGGQGGIVVTMTASMSAIDGFIITGGSATNGGGILCDGPSPRIENNSVIGNNAAQNGGGIYSGNGSPLIRGNYIADNDALESGGGMWCRWGQALIVNNMFSGNTAEWYGGGLYCEDGVVTNNVFTDNTASSGGGIRFHRANITNNTIVDNTADAMSGGGVAGGGDYYNRGSLSNNIICFNSTGAAAWDADYSHNDVYGNPGGDYFTDEDHSTDISADPLFFSPVVTSYVLSASSPCINAGDNQAFGIQATDMQGSPRVNGIVDIGAFEYTIIRVSTTGDDDNDGSTWALAKRTVQAGAYGAAAPFDVWVAAGVYEERIDVPAGVQLYGGFSGVEDERSQRDWRVNETILDAGQIGSVVYFGGSGYTEARIDGFTIRNGLSLQGGGIMCSFASPTIANNHIIANACDFPGCYVGAGGGINCNGADPIIEYNTIAGNRALFGGGIYSDNASFPTIRNNVISGNEAIYDDYESGAGGWGGGLYIDGSTVLFDNTIVNNSRAQQTGRMGGGIYIPDRAEGVNYLLMINNIIASNTDGIAVYTGGPPDFWYNDVWGNELGNYVGIPDLTGIDGNISEDPMFARDGFHIQPDSPCVDNGDNEPVQPGWLDIDGQPRIQPEEGTVDMGADESDGTEWAFVIHVKPDGDDQNDGQSWSTAMRTVQMGVNSAAPDGEVWVAAGTYTECVTLESGVSLYGGFAGIEILRSQRDWTLNETILDGNSCWESVVSAGTGVGRDSYIDGFTITDGYAMAGGGINCYDASPTIQNNKILGNAAAFDASFYGYGGGIWTGYYSEPLIQNNLIEGNYSFNGGGIYSDVSSSPVIVDNIIKGNSAVHDYYEAGYGGWGGGIGVNGAALIANNTIVGNSRSNYEGCAGGGIQVDGGSPIIANNIICFNDDGVSAAQGATPSLTYNCVFGNNLYNYSPGLTPGTGSISVDPLLASLTYGDMHIQPTSPCRNAGNTGLVEPGWLDMDLQERVEGGTVDIGADESYGEVWNYIMHVKPDGDDEDDGFTWATAKQTIQAGIDAAAEGKEVWVKEGTYNEQPVLADQVALFGGFEGTELLRDSRDWVNNVTRIQGPGGGNCGPVVRVVDASSSTNRIDGFDITGGEGQAYVGAGIYCEDSTLTVANNSIHGNLSGPEYADAGGVWCSGSDVTIENNEITGNSAFGGGGGIFMSMSSGSITRNTITGNSAYFGGGIYLITSSSTLIADNVICDNTSSAGLRGGGGIYCDSSSPMIVNNTIADNTSAVLGGGISCQTQSSPVIENSIIAFCSSGIYADGTSHPVSAWNDVYGNTAYNYQGLTPTEYDISANPQFVSLTEGDYHLLSTSPCIDIALAQGQSGLDRDGVVRPVDGDGNGNAGWDIGAYEYVPDLGILRRTAPNGTRVNLLGVSVTACFLGADPSGDNWVYVENAERTVGIRVKTPITLSIDDLVNVAGTLQTDTVNGERYIQADQGNPVDLETTQAVASLGMRNQWIGGAASGPIPVLKDGFGFYNTGMLTQTWGQVIYRSAPAAGYFYINDGSNLYDGSLQWGIRVTVPSGVTMPNLGQYVRVTGISSAVKIGNNYVRALRARAQGDIQVVTNWFTDPIDIVDGQWNMLSIPGIPRYPNAEAIFVACPSDPAIVLEGNLKDYRVLDQWWVYYNSCYGYPNCLVAEGHGLYIPPAGAECYDYERTLVTGDQLVSLPRGSTPVQYFSFIGNPFDVTRSWSAMKVTDGSAIVSLPDAVSLGWVYKVEYWDGSNWQQVTDLSSGSMAKRTGYCIYMKMNNLALYVPAQ